MQSLVRCRGARKALLGLVSVMSLGASAAFAQTPIQEPFAPTPTATPVPSISSTVASPSAAAPGAMTQAQLAEEVRQLRILVNQLSAQRPGGGVAPAAGGTFAPGMGTAGPDVGSEASTVAPSAKGGSGAPGQSLPPNPPASARFNQPATLASAKANVIFGPGFEIRSDDDEYVLQFHNLTQFEYRGYEQGGQSQVHDSFLIPRQWFMFSGRLTKPIGYFVSFANGFDTFSILDVFTDLDFSSKFRVRSGRFKTPFTYEFMVEPVQGLVVAERSVYFNNFAQNRDLGIMPYGRLFNNKLDYAGGIFNGSRNGFVANQDGKFFSGFLNYRPFGDEENTLLENFNIGGSVYTGHNNQADAPQTLRTVVPTTGNAVAGVPFLGFNSNTVESGPMTFWDLHFAYFYQQLAVIGEWGSGSQSYATTANLNASYLVTGETRSSIGIVKPLHPIDFGRGNGFSGTGAVEPYFRYEHLNIGNQVFTGGLADPNNWTNSLFMTHVGVNWHLTQYVKMYFDWAHAEFGSPVLYAPGHRQKTSDMFMARFQFYF